jgi:leader peptidase (prepilin peptidase)/N-methyltransferase
MVPVVSWISLRGHCRSCSGPINPLHPAAETLAIVLAGWAAFVVPASVLGVSLLFGWILLAISLIDLSRQVIPDRLSIPLAAAGLIVAALLDRTTITDHLLGAMGGFLSLWPVAIAYRHMRGRTGMGGGDPKLFGAIGAWVAWQGLPGVLLYASLSGLIHALLLFLWGRGMTRATRIPFGPHLALGAWLVWLYGPLVIG